GGDRALAASCPRARRRGRAGARTRCDPAAGRRCTARASAASRAPDARAPRPRRGPTGNSARTARCLRRSTARWARSRAKETWRPRVEERRARREGVPPFDPLRSASRSQAGGGVRTGVSRHASAARGSATLRSSQERESLASGRRRPNGRFSACYDGRMFTGIVQARGSIRERTGSGGGLRLGIVAPFASLALGESIAVNGVCLTVERVVADGFEADVSAETVRCTTLGALSAGAAVNLERALAA